MSTSFPDNCYADYIKQESDKESCISSITIKNGPKAEFEVISQIVNLKFHDLEKASNAATKQNEIIKKRYSKRYNLADKDDQPEIKVIDASKSKHIPNFESVENNICSTETNSDLEKVISRNVKHIKAEKELIIVDYLNDSLISSPCKALKTIKKSGSKPHKRRSDTNLECDREENEFFLAEVEKKHHTTVKSIKYHQTDNDSNFEIVNLLSNQNLLISSDDNDQDFSDYGKSKKNLKDRKFKCVHCHLRFKLLVNFNKHKCLVCQCCMKLFSTKCALKKHILHIHTETDEIYECKDCNKTFKAQTYLEAHIKSHDKTLECNSCGMKFGSNSRLNEHSIKHRNPETITCNICDKTFASRSSLKFHMRIHDEDRIKNLKCDKCSYATDDKRSLLKHQISHSRQEEKFKKSTNWLKCEKCTAKLKNKQSLYNHMYYVHSEISFQCNLCGKTVKTERNLRRHLQNVHKNDNKT